MIYKVNYENIKRSLFIGKILFFIALVGTIIVSSVIFPAYIKKSLYKGEIDASQIIWTTSGNSYYPTFVYYIDGEDSPQIIIYQQYH